MGDNTIEMTRIRKEEIFQQVQTEMVAWQQHNFPNRPNWIPLMGMVEEIGELVEAESKKGIEDTTDAIGDTAIYLADYCNGRKFSLYDLYYLSKSTDGWHTSNFMGLSIETGRLAHAHIKQFQGIRLNEGHEEKAKTAISRILFYLNDIAAAYNTTLADCIKETWAVVKKRDWQKNRDTAHVNITEDTNAKT